MMLKIQEFIQNIYPGLLPLLVIPLSLVQGWHCAVMCGPIYAAKNPQQKEKYLMGRMLSYTFVGGLFGAFGFKLKEMLEVKAFGAVAFFVFLMLTILLTMSWVGRGIKISVFSTLTMKMAQSKSAFVQGLFSVALPCTLLSQIFSLSVLSNSILGGALIGLTHASTSTLSLWLGAKLTTSLLKKFSGLKWLAKSLVLLMVLFNLFYFAGILLHTKEGAKSKILFCF